MESKQRKVREHRVEVRLSEAEYQLIEINNPFNSIAKLLRQSALDEVVNIHNSKAEESKKIKPSKVVKTSYSSTEKALLLELARVGNNVNQIAKAVNTDISSTGAFDTVKLLHLLISIDQQLRELRPDDR